MPASPVVDIWANVIPPRFSERWADAGADRAEEGAKALFGDDLFATETTVDDLVGAMDGAGVDQAVITLPFRTPDDAHPKGLFAPEDFLDDDAGAGRIFVAGAVNEPGREPAAGEALAERARHLAEHDRFVLVRITPFLDQVPLNDRRYHPLYETCEEVGLPVSINVGVPGPRARSACQHPELLEDVLIDFPELIVIGAHMGHPYEALLVTYMLKWDRLYLSNSAYLADYMDDGLVRFMNSSRGRGKVMFASDHPVLPMERALESARKLPLDDEAMAEFLGTSAARVLELPD